jgi:hypothetical protein
MSTLCHLGASVGRQGSEFMEPVRVDFLQDNLIYGGFEPETCEEVRSATSCGKVVRTVDGWPVISLERGSASYLLDGPTHYH